jgi:predicted component of type VI protein secretion system
MNRFESFLVGLASGIAGLYLLMHFTIIRANDGFHWIPKLNAKLDLPYEDVRDFSPEHWQRRPALTMSILRARKGYLMDHRTKLRFQQTTQQAVNQVRQQNGSNALLAGSR